MAKITSYHIFSNEVDEYTDDLREAEVIFEGFVKEYGCARLYEEQFEGGQMIQEDCIKSVGGFPF